MASDSDKLPSFEELLRENLKLKHQLGAEIAKARGGSKSQRVTRGFQRLALFLAVIPLLLFRRGTVVQRYMTGSGDNNQP